METSHENYGATSVVGGLSEVNEILASVSESNNSSILIVDVSHIELGAFDNSQVLKSEMSLVVFASMPAYVSFIISTSH